MEGTPPDPHDLDALGRRLAETLYETVKEAVDATRAAEAVGAAVVSLHTPLRFLEAAFELDPELAPELGGALQQIREAAEVLDRAGTFITSRFQVRLAKIAENLGTQLEGGTPE